jgi:hypothetical protein
MVAAVSPWFRNGPGHRYAPGVGRPDQPPGRHVQRARPNAVDMCPVGQAFRVPHDRDTLEALDSIDNDPNSRTTTRRGTK